MVECWKSDVIDLDVLMKMKELRIAVIRIRIAALSLDRGDEKKRQGSLRMNMNKNQFVVSYLAGQNIARKEVDEDALDQWDLVQPPDFVKKEQSSGFVAALGRQTQPFLAKLKLQEH